MYREPDATAVRERERQRESLAAEQARFARALFCRRGAVVVTYFALCLLLPPAGWFAGIEAYHADLFDPPRGDYAGGLSMLIYGVAGAFAGLLVAVLATVTTRRYLLPRAR